MTHDISDLHGCLFVGIAVAMCVGYVAMVLRGQWRSRQRGRAALELQRVAAANGPKSVRPRPDGPSTETDNPDFIDGHDWETSGFQSTVEVGVLVEKKTITKFHSGPKNDWDY